MTSTLPPPIHKAICPKNPEHQVFQVECDAKVHMAVDPLGNVVQQHEGYEITRHPRQVGTWICSECAARAQFVELLDTFTVKIQVEFCAPTSKTTKEIEAIMKPHCDNLAKLWTANGYSEAIIIAVARNGIVGKQEKSDGL